MITNLKTYQHKHIVIAQCASASEDKIRTCMKRLVMPLQQKHWMTASIFLPAQFLQLPGGNWVMHFSAESDWFLKLLRNKICHRTVSSWAAHKIVWCLNWYCLSVYSHLAFVAIAETQSNSFSCFKPVQPTFDKLSLSLKYQDEPSYSWVDESTTHRTVISHCFDFQAGKTQHLFRKQSYTKH